MFRDAYAQRRCIVPVDGFFEWRAIRGARAKHIMLFPAAPQLVGLWDMSRGIRFARASHVACMSRPLAA